MRQIVALPELVRMGQAMATMPTILPAAGPAASLAELCAHDQADFVSSAYQTLLGRLPDQAGMEYYLERLNAGVAKLSIIAQLRRSPEGRAHDPGIGGLDKAIRRHVACNRPLLGAIVRPFLKGEPDDYHARQMRAIERRLVRLENRLLGVHLDLTNRTEAINLKTRLVAEAVAGAPAGQSDGSPQSGLFRVHAGKAEFWSAISGAPQ